MQNQTESVKMRVTTKEIMEVKDAYDLLSTKSAIKFLFEQYYPNKELLLEHGYTSDPCHINPDVVVISVTARRR